MRQRLLALIHQLEQTSFAPGAFFLTFLAIIFGRIALENFLVDFGFQFSDYYFYQFTHHFFTFTLIFLVSLLLFRWAGQVSLKEAASLVLFGFLIVWTPPIIDDIISKGEGFWSFYAFDSLAGLGWRFLTFFGDKPHIGITYGIRVEIALAVGAIALYAYLKSRRFMRALVAALSLYAGLFLIGAFPSLVTVLVNGWAKGFLAIDGNDVAALMLSATPLFGLTPPNLLSSLSVKMSLVFAFVNILLIAGIGFVFFRPLMQTLLRNARYPQLTYHGGLLLLGALLVFRYGQPAFSPDLFHALGLLLLLIAVGCAWLASVVVNDFHDLRTDLVSNAARPLPTASIPEPLYRTLGFGFFLASIILAMLVSTQAGLLLLAYQGLAWIYSAWPLRLKRFPGIATALAATASLLILFIGYIVLNASKNITGLPWQIPALLFVAYTLMLPLKDFKDIAGDRADGVFTLPVLLGEATTKRLLGAFLFLLFVSSVFVLNLRSLFPIALLFGSAGYWILHIASPNHRTFPYRSLAGWFMALVTLYGLFLVASV